MSEVDSTQRFSSRVTDYLAARPPYPASIVTHLKKLGALPEDASVIDVGVGTGLSSEPFLRAGFEVIGIEPNDAMRIAGEEYLKEFPRYRAVNGTADATTLAAASANLMIAGQAFHWFDPKTARAEALRVLQATGWAALLWNDRDEVSTPFLAAYEALLRAHSGDYRDIRHKHESNDAIATFFGFAPVHVEGFAHARHLNWNGLTALVGSASYLPAPGAQGHAEMLVALRKLYDAYASDDGVEMRYTCRVHAAPMKRNEGEA